MSDLNSRELELVAIGAALGSNCAPCIEYHIPKAREAGLTDREILAAVKHADLVRQVPARKVLKTAVGLLPCADLEVQTAADEGCGCEAISPGNAAKTNDAGCGCE